jgi:hypothetical protein
LNPDAIGLVNPSALWQLDVQNEAGSSELDRRALPDQDPDCPVTVVPDGHVLRLEDLRARFDAFVFAREVHPEEQAAHLRPLLTSVELVPTDSLCMPDAAARSELQQRSGLQSSSLHRATGTGAVTRARRTGDRIPEVVEPTMLMPGVEAGLLPCDANDALVHEDVRIHCPIRNSRGRQGFEDVQAHDGADVSVLDQDDLALLCVDLDGHGALLLSD